MSIESEVFAKCTVRREALFAFGFREEAGKAVYRQKLEEESLEIILIYDGALTGRILDPESGGEYTLFRMENAEGFAGKVREKYIGLLREIRGKCCENRFFAGELSERIAVLIREEFGAEPEFLWEKYPSFAVFRKKENRKWFAFIGTVPGEKLDPALKGRGEIAILNVKIAPEKRESLMEKDGCYPAYHMNKKTWITLLLDGSIPEKEILPLVKESFLSL